MDQKQQRRLHKKWEARVFELSMAQASGRLEGLELLASSEVGPFKRWMRGKVLRSLVVQVGGQVFTQPWVIMLWRVRHAFVTEWAVANPDGAAITDRVIAAAWSRLRYLVECAARRPELSAYLDSCLRLVGARGLVQPAREAWQTREQPPKA